MKKHSAGILVYKTLSSGDLVVLLAHPGGPFWRRKDEGAWSIPKGLYEPPEAAFDAAKREFYEEIGQASPDGKFIELGEFNRSDGKNICAWAVEGDVDITRVVSNTFEMEWPPHSGRKQAFPEIDRAEWFPLPVAAIKLSDGQDIFLIRLAEKLGLEPPVVPEQQQLI